MPLTINTNSAAASANYHLSRNQSALQKSLTKALKRKSDRPTRGRRRRPCGLHEAREFDHTTQRSSEERSKRNLFLEVQDGVLASAGKILNRMIELKGLSDDVMKNSSDIANYNREFQDLQQQIYDMASLKFNGVSMFAQFSSETNNAEGVFND